MEILGYVLTAVYIVLFAGLILSVTLYRKELAKALKGKITKRSLIALLFILIFFVVFLALFVGPAEQLYFDENIEYTNINPIQVTQVGCNTNQTTAHIHTYATPVAMNAGENSTFAVTCYSGTSPFTGQLDSMFSGSVVINYTDARTGFQNLIYGKLVTKVIRS